MKPDLTCFVEFNGDYNGVCKIRDLPFFKIQWVCCSIIQFNPQPCFSQQLLNEFSNQMNIDTSFNMLDYSMLVQNILTYPPAQFE